MPSRPHFSILATATAALALSGCGGNLFTPVRTLEQRSMSAAGYNVTSIGINAHLWRATLDALSFMPLLQTDAAGGVIVTDWYVNPNSASERMKLTVSILDVELRADALRVAAVRQTLQNGQWVNAPVQAATVQKLEETILTRARDLRRASLELDG